MPAAKPRTVTAQLEGALKSATWLIDADAAAVEIARRLAIALDQADDHRDIVVIAKQLNDVLGSLGMNVGGRTGKAEAPKKEVSPLDAIKAQNKTRQPVSKIANARGKTTKQKRPGNRTS